MALTTLGVVKIAGALKCAITGLAAAVPPLLHNSALASQQLATLATPVVVAGAATIGALAAKGAAALKTGIAGLTTATTKTAASIAATNAPATASAGAAAQPALTTAIKAVTNGVVSSTL